jgi:ligand-binding SRPBCC domain-containing protein
MSTYQYKTEQVLKISLNQAWDFFSSPKNLAVITPPEMDFNILTKLEDKEIYEDMIIDYTVKPLWGIKMKWQTKIINVEKPYVFSDTQTKGPYSLWEHTHTFKQVQEGVLMTDIINYALPMGFLGNIMHTLVVKKEIEKIFSHRRKTLEQLFNKN